MEQATWLEISLTVDGELAEAVADVLSRFLPNGVAIESTAVSANMDDSEGHAVGPLRVFGFLRLNDRPDHSESDLEGMKQKIEEALWFLSRIRPLPPAQYRIIYESDWSESWKKHYNPILVGNKLAIIPAWLENPFPDRVEIRMDPGMAFGTGTHPTTQLCLEFIEEAITPGMELIDIGCGSGILSIGALKLGATHALAVDIDPDAVRVTRENAVLNNVESVIEIAQGSVIEIAQGAYSVRKAPLILANILAPVLIQLLNEGLGSLLTAGGDLILSGIIDTQVADIQQALEKNGLLIDGKKQFQDWVAIKANHA